MGYLAETSTENINMIIDNSYDDVFYYDHYKYYDLISFIRKVINEELRLDEGILITFPLSKIRTFLIKNGYIEGIDFKTSMYGGKPSFTITYNVDNRTKDKYDKIIKTITNIYGWSHGCTINLNDKSHGILFKNKIDFLNKEHYGKRVELSFEPINDIAYNVSEFDPPLFYHITNKHNLNKIMSIGLKPTDKDSMFSYVNRLHLSERIEDIEKILLKLYLNVVTNNPKVKPLDKRDLETFTMLEINLGDYRDLEIFADPNSGGYYIKSNISPKNIKPILEYKIIDNGSNFTKNKIN